jgi:hypothetical protein
MNGSRPSIQSVQRSLIFGVLAGLIVGCLVGAGLGLYYAWRVNPAVYAGGSYPAELAPGYRTNYIHAVIDSYIVNRQVEVARQRLQTFDEATKIQALGQRSADFIANGQAVEAELTNQLAVELKAAEGWSDETIQTVIRDLAAGYQGDNARAQAVNTFSASLLEQVPVVPTPSAGEPVQPPPTAAPTAPAKGGGIIAGFSGLQLALCCVGLLAIILIILAVGRWQFQRSRRAPARPAVEWEGEGPAPIKQWSGTYELGQDNYDEFFTIETLEGDFLGESGMGILEAIPGTSPKQVIAFDVGLFDKTDITTLSRVVMSEYAYHDDTIRAKIEANPQAEAVLAEPGAEFSLETSALRVVATIDDMDYGEGNVYFNKLTLTLNVFIREGADLRIGTMDVPEQFQ